MNNLMIFAHPPCAKNAIHTFKSLMCTCGLKIAFYQDCDRSAQSVQISIKLTDQKNRNAFDVDAYLLLQSEILNDIFHLLLLHKGDSNHMRLKRTLLIFICYFYFPFLLTYTCIINFY